jgi:hypothetical protein
MQEAGGVVTVEGIQIPWNSLKPRPCTQEDVSRMQLKRMPDTNKFTTDLAPDYVFVNNLAYPYDDILYHIYVIRK